MLLRTYKVKNNHIRIRNGKEYAYISHKTTHDIECDVCKSVFVDTRDIGRFGHGEKHMCPSCHESKQIGVILRQHRIDKEDRSRIGEVRIHSNGKYPEVYVGYGSWHSRTDAKWCRQHIYVMEEHLGYKIPKGMVVHHIDGDKINNDINNLVLMTVAEHNNAHAKSELLIFELVKKGIVIFNRITNLYEFT